MAHFDGDRLTLHVSTQAVSDVQSEIAKRLALDQGKTRVVAQHVGGGFGVAQGAPASTRTIAACAAAATVNANPLPLTGYKLALLRGLVGDALERLLA